MKNKQKKKVLGNKIKTFEINNSLNKHILLSFLIVFNISLFVGLCFLASFITRWYIILISVLIFIYSIIHSLITFIKTDKNHSYELYENYLVIHTLLFSAEIETNSILDAKVTKTWFDKLFKLKTTSIKVSFKRTFTHDVTLTFLTEESDEIRKIIMNSTINK